jgi:flagellar protein FlaF
MQHAHDAYSSTATVTMPPRQLEASVLLKAASQLQDIHDSWSGDIEALENVLNYNRRLWTVFLGSVAEADHPLPKEIRNNIASLGVFVFGHSMSLIEDPAPEKLLPLININKEIAAGLHSAA